VSCELLGNDVVIIIVDVGSHPNSISPSSMTHTHCQYIVCLLLLLQLAGLRLLFGLWNTALTMFVSMF
jgi:hypothetical protein